MKIIDAIKKRGYGNNIFGKSDKKCKLDQIKRQFNEDSTKGIRCFECGGRGHIQSECENLLKRTRSYNTTVCDENDEDIRHDTNDEEQESNVDFYLQFTSCLLACVNSVDCANNVVDEFDNDDLSKEELQEM